MEKVLHKQIIQFLNTENLLYQYQDGFRPGRSTHHSIEKLTNSIFDELNLQNCTTAIYLDFSKAFDTLNHNILSKKLTNLGFGQNSLSLIQNYLTDRVQRTKANGLLSDYHIITCGVPQGSVLGPLLFLTYINDMHTVLNTMKCQHYADDTVLYFAHSPLNDPSTAINKDLQNIAKWCNSNKLSLNSKKNQDDDFCQ